MFRERLDQRQTLVMGIIMALLMVGFIVAVITVIRTQKDLHGAVPTDKPAVLSVYSYETEGAGSFYA